MTRPTKISNSPILEVVAEIRFNGTLPSAALFGNVYSELSSKLGAVEQMPILQMPVDLIRQNPELEYAVHYRIKNDKFTVSIGEKIIGISRVADPSADPYAGWEELQPLVQEVIGILQAKGGITQVERVLVRYINLIEDFEKITDKLNVNLDILGADHSSTHVNVVNDLPSGNKMNILINDQTTVTSAKGVSKTGLLLQLEASNESIVSLEDTTDAIDALHVECEHNFFDILNPDYLETLNPS